MQAAVLLFFVAFLPYSGYYSRHLSLGITDYVVIDLQCWEYLVLRLLYLYLNIQLPYRIYFFGEQFVIHHIIHCRSELELECGIRRTSLTIVLPFASSPCFSVFYMYGIVRVPVCY